MRPLLVGEAPGGDPAATHPQDQALTGATGRNIARLVGLTYEEYLERTRRVNIFKTPQERWDRAHARWIAANLSVGIESNTKVVLLGTRVADAFGVGHWQNYAWHKLHPGVYAVRVPHPSGRNRVLNEDEERASFRRALLEALS